MLSCVATSAVVTKYAEKFMNEKTAKKVDTRLLVCKWYGLITQCLFNLVVAECKRKI